LLFLDSKQNPPFLHGLLSHSSLSSAQFAPSKPATHLHLYWSLFTAHLAPLKHGELSHGLTSAAQLQPENPAAQTQP
jgi:hypothetical protein